MLGEAKGEAAAEVLARETEHSTLGADGKRPDTIRDLYSMLGEAEGKAAAEVLVRETKNSCLGGDRKRSANIRGLY